jgi:hypothetical protein
VAQITPSYGFAESAVKRQERKSKRSDIPKSPGLSNLRERQFSYEIHADHQGLSIQIMFEQQPLVAAVSPVQTGDFAPNGGARQRSASPVRRWLARVGSFGRRTDA